MNKRTESGDVHESQRIRALVGRARVRELTRRSDGPGLVFTMAHVTFMLGTGYLLHLSLGTWWVVPATFLHGIGIVHLFAPYHECVHNTPFKSMWLNRAVGFVTGLVLFLLPHAFRYQHADHHTYTQDVALDPQAIPMGETLGGYLFYASGIPYFKSLSTTLLRHPFGKFNESELRSVPVSAFGAVRRESYIFWAIYLTMLLVSLWFQSWALVIYWLIPRLVAEPVERIIRMSEHVGCPRADDMLRNTRTVRTLAPVRWLSWNMPYHAEHHAIPLVPFHKLGELHEILRPHLGEVREGYLATVRHLIRNGIENSAKTRSAAA